MSLRFRLAALLFAVVLGTLGLAWILTGTAVLRPFTRDLEKAHVDQAIYVAEEIEAGADPEKLARRLGLEIRVTRRLPRFGRPRGGHGPEPGLCRPERIRDRDLAICQGPRAPVAVALSSGWVVVRRNLDFSAPRRRFEGLLLLIAALVVGISAWAAVRITRPLRISIEAMERIASGDLGHRLQLTGGRELAEVARAFNRMADRVDALLRAERELMAGISHELRTPLARLRLQTELLRDQEIPETRLSAMDGDLEDIDRLVGELLEHCRLTIGERKLARAPVDLRAVVDDALRARPLPNHNLRVEGDSCIVSADRARLARVVANLLENAGKYAPAGTEVVVRIVERGIEVLDRGPGVAADELTRIFEPFFRGVERRKASGLGLGLMIARQIVLMHGGDIEASLREGGGLAIRFTLPSQDVST